MDNVESLQQKIKKLETKNKTLQKELAKEQRENMRLQNEPAKWNNLVQTTILTMQKEIFTKLNQHELELSKLKEQPYYKMTRTNENDRLYVPLQRPSDVENRPIRPSRGSIENRTLPKTPIDGRLLHVQHKVVHAPNGDDSASSSTASSSDVPPLYHEPYIPSPPGSFHTSDYLVESEASSPSSRSDETYVKLPFNSKHGRQIPQVLANDDAKREKGKGHGRKSGFFHLNPFKGNKKKSGKTTAKEELKKTEDEYSVKL